MWNSAGRFCVTQKYLALPLRIIKEVLYTLSEYPNSKTLIKLEERKKHTKREKAQRKIYIGY
jgi:hypothetical protein